MADPKALKRFPEGVRLGPAAIDTVPSDWATVDYDIKLRPHPDLPGVAILKFVLGGASASYAFLYLTGIDGDGNTVLITDETGAPISAYTPV